MVEINKIESSKVEIVCTIDGDKWHNSLKKASNKLTSNLEVKGFRKGQVPQTLIKKYINDEQIRYEAAQMIAQDELVNAVTENDIELVDRPDFNVGEINDDKCVLKFVCPTCPDIILKDYKTLRYKVDDVSVSDGEIEAELDKIKEQKSEIEIKEDGVVENGDIAVIDYEGFIGDTAFEGGKDENHELTIGSGQFIPGFEEQLIGMKSEENKDIKVTFPEDYHAEELKGKEATFKIKLHEIKKKVLPELNDELIKELKIENVNNIEELKKHIKETLFDRKKNSAENKASEDLLNSLIEGVDLNIPTVMIENEVNNLFQEQANNFMMQGMNIEQYLKYFGQTIEKYKEDLKPDAIKRIKTTLALKKVFENEKLDVTKEDIEKEYEVLAKKYNISLDDAKKYVKESMLKNDLKSKKAFEFLKALK